MELDFEYQDGQTPLNEEEKEGLLISSITTHGELNEHEQLNIEKAIEWIIQSKLTSEKILTEKFIKNIHKKMLGKVWSWAGKFRKTEKNIGIECTKIGVELKYLLDDAKFWIKNKTYTPDDIAIRFKHRLVNIHCFSNGNGRHSRIMADIIIESIFNQKLFTWHSSNMGKANKTRKKYIETVRDADKGNINSLIDFARN